MDYVTDVPTPPGFMPNGRNQRARHAGAHPGVRSSRVTAVQKASGLEYSSGVGFLREVGAGRVTQEDRDERRRSLAPSNQERGDGWMRMERRSEDGRATWAGQPVAGPAITGGTYVVSKIKTRVVPSYFKPRGVLFQGTRR